MIRPAKLFGKMKIWQQRLSTYVSMVNFAMVFYLYIIESPLGLEWFHWLAVIVTSVVLVMFIDVRFIMPYSLAYNFEKNPQFMSLRNDVQCIRDDMGMLKEMIENGEGD